MKTGYVETDILVAALEEDEALLATLVGSMLKWERSELRSALHLVLNSLQDADNADRRLRS